MRGGQPVYVPRRPWCRLPGGRRRRGSAARGESMDETQTLIATVENFATAVIETSNRVPVLVDFWASWCAPCRTLMPVLDRIAQDYAGRLLLAKLNVDEEQEVAAHFGIRSIPTVL